MKTSNTTIDATKPSEVPQEGLKRAREPFVLEWGAVFHTEIIASSPEEAESHFRWVANENWELLIDMPSTFRTHFKLMKVKGDLKEMNGDVRAKAGSTQNKIALKKATKLNPPANALKAKKVSSWLSVKDNLRWAEDRHKVYAARYTAWYDKNGFLSDKQLKCAENTKRNIQRRTNMKEEELFNKIYREKLEDGHDDDAKNFKDFYLKNKRCF